MGIAEDLLCTAQTHINYNMKCDMMTVFRMQQLDKFPLRVTVSSNYLPQEEKCTTENCCCDPINNT